MWTVTYPVHPCPGNTHIWPGVSRTNWTNPSAATPDLVSLSCRYRIRVMSCFSSRFIEHSPSHVRYVLGRHVEDAVWQMLLWKTAHQQYIVYGVLHSRQIVNAHTRPRHHLGAVVGDEQRQANAIAQILKITHWRYIRRLQTRTLHRNQK